MQPVNILIDTCPVCRSQSHSFFVETSAMMHDTNEERFAFYKCNACKSAFLRNPVDESTLSAYYLDSYLPYRGSAAWGRFANFVDKDDAKLNRKRVKLAASCCSNKDEPSILDIGCGKPDFLLAFNEKHQSNAVGVDFVAAHWDAPKYRHLKLHECNWKTFNFDAKFHVITAWHYLEHDYDLAFTITKIHELLISGGYFIAEVPMYQSILQRAQKKHWQGWHSPRHLTLFSKKSWSILFPKTHWEIVKHQKYGTLSAFTLWWLGHREGMSTDWKGSMEKYFWELVFWKVVLSPFFILDKLIPLGVQTIIVRKK